jgi:hypothetical protein
MIIPFLFYSAAAFATGWQISQQILMGVWGKPSNSLGCEALRNRRRNMHSQEWYCPYKLRI